MAFVDTWLARRVLAVIALGLLAIALAWAVLDAAFADIGGAPPAIDAAHATAVATTAKLSAADQARKQVFDERRQRLQSPEAARTRRYQRCTCRCAGALSRLGAAR